MTERTDLKEGAGEAWAGQFKLYDVRCEMEKYPRCLESEENVGELKPMGSKIILFLEPFNSNIA